MKRKTLIITLFLVFVFLRVFTSTPINFLDADDVRWLLFAESFPYHTSINYQMEPNHGPFFPYVVHFFTLVFRDDYIASVLVSLLSACITFFVIYKLFMMLTDNFFITFVVMLFFTLSAEFVMLAKVGLKESFYVMLIVLSIYYFIKGVKFNDRKSLLAASILAGLVTLTVEQSIFLFPAFILTYIFFGKINLRTLSFPNLKYVLLSLLIVFLFFASWTGVKAYQYSINDYYPAGQNGQPVSTENFNLLQLLNPRYFEGYEPVIVGKFNTRILDYAYGIGYMFNTIPFLIPGGLDFSTMHSLLLPRHVAYMVLVYLPLALAVIVSLVFILDSLIKTKSIYNNTHLYVLLVFLIFIFPLTQYKCSSRYISVAFIFLYYLIGYGLFILCKRIPKKSKILVPILLLLLIPVWYVHNPYFLYSNEKVYYLRNTVDFVNDNLEEDAAMMVQTGYIYELQYLTDRRTVGLYPTSENLLPLIDYYGIDYIVFGKFYTWNRYFYCKESIDYVMNHPGKFKLIGTIEENYDEFRTINLEMGRKMRPSDEVYIYKVTGGG